MSDDDISPKDFEFVSENGHILAGALAVFMPVVLIGPAWRFWGALAIIVFAALKEGIYDRFYETPAVRGSSLRDFLDYAGGVAFALLLYWVFVTDWANIVGLWHTWF